MIYLMIEAGGVHSVKEGNQYIRVVSSQNHASHFRNG